MTKGDYERMKRTPEERLAGLIETFRASRTPSSQRNAKQRMREICREFNLPLPLEAKQTVPNTPKAQPETTGAIAALPSSAQAAKGAPAPGSAAINQPFDPSTTPAQAALRRMRKEGWLLLAAAETLSRTERQALKENLELVRSQLDMALSLVGGAA